MWRDDIAAALGAFRTVAELANAPLAADEIHRDDWEFPNHTPRSLPSGTMAVYGFWWDGIWLKIGEAGANSNARYQSQHYSLNGARSTLAKSLASDDRMLGVAGFDPAQPGAWIRSATNRVNILVSAERGDSLRCCLEAFLHLRLKPRYEG